MFDGCVRRGRWHKTEHGGSSGIYMVGYFDTQMVKEFFYAISYSAGMNLHIRKITGENDHHIIEGMFKAFAKALDEACMKDARIKSVLSTKGSL